MLIRSPRANVYVTRTTTSVSTSFKNVLRKRTMVRQFYRKSKVKFMFILFSLQFIDKICMRTWKKENSTGKLIRKLEISNEISYGKHLIVFEIFWKTLNGYYIWCNGPVAVSVPNEVRYFFRSQRMDLHLDTKNPRWPFIFICKNQIRLAN